MSATTFSVMTLYVKDLPLTLSIITLNINDIQHFDIQEYYNIQHEQLFCYIGRSIITLHFLTHCINYTKHK
jgi:hypothetical protein